MDVQITIKQNELRTTREAAREMNSLLDQLAAGDIEKIVLTRRGQISGVLVSVNRYTEMTNGPEHDGDQQ